ncbi:hypothetical protein GH714_001009 [Hevea brasiliensis]|uniref:Uncharacterized protein n=1 Tax=Hevea brasiliensis TaxID=3981 RepID=A0A6A6K3S0_HEVBR|nr:hypothetical protein GH714_001009 [Hevea brasiliensis]
MNQIKFLNFYHSNVDVDNFWDYDEFIKYVPNNVHFPKDLASLPKELRYLQWHFYPLDCLPSQFHTEKLVELNMSGSHVSRLWNGVQQNLANLKAIKLCYCTHLIEMPNVTGAKNLETIDCRGCISLVEKHSKTYTTQNITCSACNDHTTSDFIWTTLECQFKSNYGESYCISTGFEYWDDGKIQPTKQVFVSYNNKFCIHVEDIGGSMHSYKEVSFHFIVEDDYGHSMVKKCGVQLLYDGDTDPESNENEDDVDESGDTCSFIEQEEEAEVDETSEMLSFTEEEDEIISWSDNDKEDEATEEEEEAVDETISSSNEVDESSLATCSASLRKKRKLIEISSSDNDYFLLNEVLWFLLAIDLEKNSVSFLGYISPYRTMPPKAVGSRGRGVNRGRVAHRIRLSDAGQPCRDAAIPPPPPNEVVDHDELHEGGDEHGDSTSHGSASAAYGLHVEIRASTTWFRGSNFRELVEAALNVEKVKQEEKEYEQKISKKHGQSSSQGFKERSAKRGGSSFQPRAEFNGSGSVSGEGSIAPRSMQIGTTPPQGRSISNGGSCMSRANGATSTAQSRPVT